MSIRGAASLLLLGALAMPLGAQALMERVKASYDTWQGYLEQGDGAGVRKATEPLLQREAQAVSPADYNEMRALVALLDLQARACVVEGDWEQAVSFLQRAADSAASNATAAETTFGRIRKEHDAKLAGWREAIIQQEAQLKELDARPGLTEDMMKRRSQIRLFLDEHRNAIAHSMWSIKEIEGILTRLRQEKETYAASLAAWQGFLAREKQELTRTGSPASYVSEKAAQIKTDDGLSRFDRIAYTRRLLRLSPEAAAREGLKGLLASLTGVVEHAKAPAKGKARKPHRKG